MTRHDSRPTISRRKVLGGIGAVGLASAGAGLGTTAFFSDEETFEGNRLVAGEFDLKIDYINRYYDGKTGTRADPSSWKLTGSYPDPYSVQTRDELAQAAYTTDFGSLNETQQADIEAQFRAQFANDDDITAALVSLDDVKPGDEGCLTFSLHLFDNPGYIWLYAADLVSKENGLTEPERKDPDEQDGEASGELEDEIMVSIFYDDDQNCQLNEGEQMIFGPGVGGFTDATGDNPATLAAAFDAMSRNNGFVPLDGDRSTPLGFDEGDTSENRDCFVNSTTQYVTMHWELPVDHANEVQTDSVEFDVGFYAEQCRHNDGSMMAPERLAATVGSGDYSQTSYDRMLGMALRYGNSNYEDGSIGRAPYEMELHPSTSGYGQNFAYASGTTYDFLATLVPGTETELAVFGSGLGRSVGDSNLATDTYTLDATGGPTAGELALTVKAQSANLSAGDSVTIEDVHVNGIPVTPASLTATKGGTELTFMALSGLDFTQNVEVAGKLTFDVDDASLPATDPHDVLTAVGIDWR